MTLEELKSKVDKLKTAYYESNHGVTDPSLELLLNYIAELEKLIEGLI